MESARQLIQSHADNFINTNTQKYGTQYDVHNAMQAVLAWNTIYDATTNMVITPISRIWNVWFTNNSPMGGFVLFCWDNYFASMMLSLDNKELAYANAVEITKTVRHTAGFVPNFYVSPTSLSFDRSQPPVGSMSVWNVYQRYKEKWFLELVYEDLLKWNRWWETDRQVDGLFCWGSTPSYRNEGEDGINDNAGAALESGLDNSHMYDNILFDTEKQVQQLNDVGLSSLYVMDCDYLAKIAGELGQSCVAEELTKRADKYRNNLAMLWDNTKGFYYNRHTNTNQLDPRTSPTCFYPLLAKAPTQAQAQRMISEHLLNPTEFWGDWVIPATPRNDPAFSDNVYWRGRIWAPLNFLVYLGVRNYDLPEAQTALSEKSKSLLLNSWLDRGYVFENYNATTGVGDDVQNSDKFYHWGALLGFISLIENGYYQYE
jgi:neutral trehalase